MGRLIAVVCSFVSFVCSAQNKNDLVWIKGGKTTIGNLEQFDAQPLFDIKVDGFWMQKYEVTNARFAEFIKQTGYITLAERNNGSYVFNSSLKEDSSTLKNAVWWKFELGVNWKHPEGIHSSVNGKEEHPVVHIAYEDACAYCEWLGMRLPTEVEREYAAKKNGEETQKNIWQGIFPEENLKTDGFYGTVPVGSFESGKLGLFDMQGNVWEWCLDSYHQHAYYFAEKWKMVSYKPLVPDCFDENSPDEETRVIRGGSFLCAENYCKGYEYNTRMRSSVNMTFSHIGFRCVKFQQKGIPK